MVLPASPDSLDLTHAIELARENSPMLAQARSGAEAAHTGKWEARASRLPSLTGRVVGLTTDSPADAFGLQLMQERFSFPAFTMSDPNDPEAIDHWSTELEARMPLFTGGKITGAIRQADRMADAAGADRDQAERGISLQVTNAYLDAILAEEGVALAERAQATTAKHVDRVRDLFETGMAIESDLLQAEVQLSKMEEGTIAARSQTAIARAALGRTIGLDLPADLPLARMQGMELPLPSSIESALQSAHADRPDLTAATARSEAARAAIKQARAGYLPEVGISGKLVWSDDHPFGSHGSSYTIAGQLQWSLWDWGATRQRVTRSRHLANVAAMEERDKNLGAELEVLVGWESLQSARARLTTATRAVGAAERAMQILEDRFDEGVTRITDLLDAETALHEARTRALDARFGVQRAARQLLFAAGQSPAPEVES
ncbi:MAG: TolC family protein [Candidatus Eisenbacteria bacterium]